MQIITCGFRLAINAFHADRVKKRYLNLSKAER